MNKFISLLLIALFFSVQFSVAQNAPVTTIGEIETYGTTAVVPITVTGFTNIGGCDLLINYDETIATATSVTVGPGVGYYYFVGNPSVPGQISVSYIFFQPGVQGQTLADGSVFLNVTFEKVTNGYSDLEFDFSYPLYCDYFDWQSNGLNDTPESTYYFNGSVTFATDDIAVSLNAFLEGPYGESEMSTDLNPSFIEHNQPYNTAPWNYNGDESFIAIPNANVVDWVLVELRQTEGDASTATASTMVARQAALLIKNGSIVGMNGISNLFFDVTVTNNLYVVILHRNHLGMMSSVPLAIDEGVYRYDFTTALSKAYLGGQVDLGDGSFGMYAGNADGDRTIGPSDLSSKWDLQVGRSGYYSADMDMNQQVNNQDKNEIWNPNFGISTQVPE